MQVSVGQAASVVPAGSLTALNGTITQISTIETSGTAGSSPTYTSTVNVADPNGFLANGSRATVRIEVATATNAVRVPVSAITPTGSHTGTVTIVDGTAATQGQTVTVTFGAVGGGYAEIKNGVTAGQLVVLADTTAPLPSNGSNTRQTTQALGGGGATVVVNPGNGGGGNGGGGNTGRGTTGGGTTGGGNGRQGNGGQVGG